MIALYFENPQKTGKTTTLKKLIHILEHNGATQIATSRQYAQKIDDARCDVWTVLEMQLKERKVYIGVITAGDSTGAITGRYTAMMNKLKRTDETIALDALLFAKHPTFQCDEWLNSIAKEKFSITGQNFIDAGVTGATNDQINQARAEYLYQMLLNLLG